MYKALVTNEHFGVRSMSINRCNNRRHKTIRRSFLGNGNDTLYVPSVSTDVRRVEHARAPTKPTDLFGNKEAPSIHIDKNNTISYSEFLLAIRNNSVSNVVLASNGRIARATIKVEGSTNQDVKVVFPEDYDVINFLVSHNVNVRISETNSVELEKTKGYTFEKISDMAAIFLQIVFQITIFGMIISVLASRGGMGGGNNGMFGITNSKATLFDPAIIDTRFSDVAGADNAKRELGEIVDFLKYPEKYTKLGARIPKGVLLYGPPGCGKTLLARSVAGEAGVPFFSTAGSSMVEVFAGVAAARIRDMFAKAKEKAPCIIFIDEIDAIGKSRSMSLSGANDERDQALNQLLTEMDGFDSNHGVIVIAATNRPDILDEALTRPGRFDRRVSVEYPDMNGRTNILKVHTRGMPLAEDVDIQKLAKNTIGFTGADLKNLCNEAAIYAARASSEVIGEVHFDQSLEKLTMGEEHSTAIISDYKKKLVAYHEAGHTLLGLVVNDFDIVRKVSITPRGNSGGATYFEPTEDRLDGSLMSREYLENKLVVALGGRVAEEIVFGKDKATTGASGDFQMVTEIAQDMVFKYGFNEDIGPMYISDENANMETEAEVRLHVEKAYQKAISILREHEFYLHRIAEGLIEKETLNESDIYNLVDGLACHLNRTRA